MKKENQGDTKLRQAVAVLPWGHNLVLMNNNLSADNELNLHNNLLNFALWEVCINFARLCG